MEYADLVKARVRTQPVYEPGKPISAVARELGLDAKGIAKLASNENPHGPSPRAREAAVREMESVGLYPDGGCTVLREAIAAKRGLAPEAILPGNGSNELLELVGHVFLEEGDEAVMGAQAFVVYKLVTLLFGARPVEVPMPDYRHDLDTMLRAVTDRTRVVFLPSPNNPTGTVNTEEEILAFSRSLPNSVLFVFDEAYAEYLESPPDLTPLMAEGRKVLCLRTFSKIYGLAGLRVGYGYGDPDLIGFLHRARQPFNVNSVAQAAAIAALEDHEWVEFCRRENAVGRDYLERSLADLGLPVVPSQANFVLAEVPNAGAAFAFLQKGGMIVRPLKPYGLPNHIRITVGTREQNQRLIGLLVEYLQRTGPESGALPPDIR